MTNTTDHRTLIEQLVDALNHCMDAIIERGLNGSPDQAEKWGLQLPLERAYAALAAGQQALEQAQVGEIAGAQSRFKNVAVWTPCTIEHHQMVQLNPGEWEGYETRLVYTHPQATEPAPNPWKDAVLNQLAAHCMDAPIDMPPDEILKRVFDMAVTMATDPAISEPAPKRPINCGTGHCSCIECVMEPAPSTDICQNCAGQGWEPSVYKGKVPCSFCHPAPSTAGELPFPEADLTGVQVCCGNYDRCGRPCTPRGRFLAERDHAAHGITQGGKV